ncbi:hypothetical protein PR048_030302 [Dryococelus australis]|uniref:Uncharacterized protein n=1 Tax=Dryococelus australis TaxID=614101 RepID=A0ABQ9G8M9_9NEOP|nr:hypothetical protein PR048_030302 [Dryococelus australis]
MLRQRSREVRAWLIAAPANWNLDRRYRHEQFRTAGSLLLPVRRGEAGVPRENPPASGIVQHDSHVRKFESEQAVHVGPEQTRHCRSLAKRGGEGTFGRGPLSAGQRIINLDLPLPKKHTLRGRSPADYLLLGPSCACAPRRRGIKDGDAREQTQGARMCGAEGCVLVPGPLVISLQGCGQALSAAAAIFSVGPPRHGALIVAKEFKCWRPPVAQTVGAPPIRGAGGSEFESRERHGQSLKHALLASKQSPLASSMECKCVVRNSEPLQKKHWIPKNEIPQMLEDLPLQNRYQHDSCIVQGVLHSLSSPIVLKSLVWAKETFTLACPFTRPADNL